MRDDGAAMRGGPSGEQIGGQTFERGVSVCVGFPVWKRPHMKPFFYSISERVIYIDDPARAVKCAKANNGRIITWAWPEKEDLIALAKAEGIDIIRMEDGFVRSVGLGSNFYVPYSLVLDKRGIYYDASKPSDLEYILEKGRIESQLLERARRLRHEITARNLTKYNIGAGNAFGLSLPKDKRTVLVPGQVEDDASVLCSVSDINTNLKLLETVRQTRPNAFILYKPHPDVLAGNRPGGVPDEAVSKLCDKIIGNISAAVLTSMVDEVHTIASLTGFEALLRGKDVYTYGSPFYAGWGLTADRLDLPRRTRRISLDELVAATLILYPTYYDWETERFCGPETILDRLSAKYSLQTGAGGLSRSPLGRLLRLFFGPYMQRAR